jgi:predicted enzyme related to lactoylglutathione lyase
MANHPIVHVEIPTINSKESAEFYAKTFDWSLEHSPEFDYWQFRAQGGPGGGFIQVGGQSDAKVNEPVLYIGTDDIEATLATIEANGGKTVLPKTEIPGIGWFAYFTDPAGNRLAIYTDMNMQNA